VAYDRRIPSVRTDCLAQVQEVAQIKKVASLEAVASFAPFSALTSSLVRMVALTEAAKLAASFLLEFFE